MRREAGKGLLIESGAVRVRRRIGTILCLIAVIAALLLLVPGSVAAQVVEVTPEFEIDRSTETTPWVIWFAIGAAVLGALVLMGVGFGYMRFAPKFFGREEASRLPPGARPAHLVREAAAVRWAPPAAATRVAAPASAPEAKEASAQASSQATAPPAGEAAVQADAVGQAEAEASEEAPSTEAPAAEAAPTEAPAATQGSSALDQETFERVLKEQTDRGVDRRVAEGRARAAAVVAARKKAQG